MRHAALLLSLCLLSMSVPAFAAEPAQPEHVLPSDLAPAVAPIAMTPAEIAAIIKAVQTPAAAPAPAPAATVSSTGLFGIAWETLAGWLGGILALVFGLLKGATALRVRKVFADCVAAAYWITDRDFADMPSADKATAFMGALYKQMEGHDIPLDPKLGAQAVTIAEKLAAENRPAVAPAVLAQAQAAAQVAGASGTATDLANAASK